MLGDAGVDQPRPECVTELVRGDGDRLAGFVMQTDDALPVSELLGEVAVRVGPGAVVVAGDAGEQPRAARWPPLADVVLLGSDRRRGLGAERDQLLSPDLDGFEAQAGPAAAVGQHRVEREAACVPAAQPGLHDHHDQVAGSGARDLREGLIGLQLCHDELGDEPGDLLMVERELFDVDGRAGSQAWQPAMTVAGLEEHPDHRQGQCSGGRRVSLGDQPGHVVLQDCPGDSAGAGGLRLVRSEEPGEPGKRERPGVYGRERASGRQAEPGPALDRVTEPLLADSAETCRAASAAGGDAQAAGVPVVRRPLAVEDGCLAVNHRKARLVLHGRCGAAHRASSCCQTPVRRSASRMSAASRWT